LEYVVVMDKRGRIVIPAEVRRRLGLKGGHRVLLRVKDDGMELLIIDRIYGDVVAVFEEKFKGWKEEDHEASKLLGRMVGLGDS